MKVKAAAPMGLLISWLSLFSACEPFQLSLFPGYIADAAALGDLSGYITPSNVEHYDFCVLGNGTSEDVFLVTYQYDGQKILYVFNSDLSFLTSLTDPNLGSRHCVDSAGNFVIGDCVLAPAAVPGSFTTSSIINHPWENGSGGVLLRGGIPANAVLESSGSSIRTQFYDNTWQTAVSSETFVAINSTGTSSYNLITCRRLQNIQVSTATLDVAVLVLRDYSSWPNQGYAVVLLETPAPGYYDFTACEPLLNPALPYRYVFSLGGIGEEGGTVFAVSEGLVVRGQDRIMRFFSWDGSIQATTRDNGASGQVYLDYGFKDYYYAFDPDTLKIYKSRDWWRKN
jgi:hypothetical protein